MMVSRERAAFDQLYADVFGVDGGGLMEAIARLNDGDTDPKRALEAVGLLRQWLDEEEASLVTKALAGGLGWSDIARSVGRSRQAVWKKYSTDAVRMEVTLHEAAARLIAETQGATNLDDVERLHGCPFGLLLAEATGIDREIVRHITGR